MAKSRAPPWPWPGRHVATAPPLRPGRYKFQRAGMLHRVFCRGVPHQQCPPKPAGWQKIENTDLTSNDEAGHNPERIKIKMFQKQRTLLEPWWEHVWSTWDLLITWLASSWMVNFTPSSEEKEAMGDRVPDVNTMLLTESLKSEKAWAMQTQSVTEHSRKLEFKHKEFKFWEVNRSGRPTWQRMPHLTSHHSRVEAPEADC